MRRFLCFWWQCAKSAFWGNAPFANDWQWLIGYPATAALLWLVGVGYGELSGKIEVTFTTGALGVLAAAFVAYLLTWTASFLVRLLNCPVVWFHQQKERIEELEKADISNSTWKSVSVTEVNLAAYIRTSPLVNKLDDQIGQDARLPINPNKTIAFPEQENAKFFGIADIAELDSLLDDNQEAVVRMASYSHTENEILRGESVTSLFHLLGGQLGEEKLSELNWLRRWHTLSPHGIQSHSNAYREISKNLKVRAPLVHDFNLIPVEEALSLARDRAKESSFAKRMPQKNGSNESELLAYFEHLKTRMTFYGNLRGRNERAIVACRPKSDDPILAFMSPVMLHPRFEGGKLVVNSQLFNKDSKGNIAATDVIYERLYVLRPDLMRVIDQLNEAKA